STHKGEDEIVLEAFAQLRKRLPEALLVLVPRHPERFNAVAALCQSRGFELVRRSEQRACTIGTAIFLGDSMGELMLFFAASDIAFVGGSLVATGGHNLLEPASLGLPILTGPHMFNFTDIHQLLLQAEASIEVGSSRHLAEALLRLFGDKTLCQSMGGNGRRLVAQNGGALDKVVRLIERVMGKL
ncbi:3-deoxy-D-manno-octulosonic acid transferase, partial [hydrothermal vent metagenome]